MTAPTYQITLTAEQAELVSRAELCLFNKRGYSSAPAEVRPTLLLAAQLDRAVTDAEKKRH